MKKNSNDSSISTPRKAQASRSSFAVCIDNSDYPIALELHKIYRVLADEDARAEGDLRVIDESGEDYIYPAERFVPLKLPSEVTDSFPAIRAPRAA